MSLLRKRGLKKIVTTMAIVSVLASSVGLNNKIYGDSIATTAIEQTLTNKTYTVQNEIEYIKDGKVTIEGSDKLRSMLSTDTVIEVKNNKIYMTLEFTKPEKGDQYSMIDNITIKVDGKVNKLTKNADENNRKYTVEIGSLDSDIQLSYDVNATIGSFVYNKNFLMNVNLPSISLDKTYTVQNEIEYIKNGQVTEEGSDKLRSMLSTDTVIEVRDNKTYMTLEFTKPEKGDQYSMIDNITITVDGKVNKLTKNADENNRKYTVEIGSLNSDIQLSYDVNATMGSFVYNKNFLMNVILDSKSEGGTEDSTPEDNTQEEEENDAVSGASTVVPDVSTGEVADNKLESGKYTIKNNTAYSSNSETGNSMVRSSLKEVSYIEVKNGEVYLTLEFAEGMYEQMKNIKITVDGDGVSPSVNGRKYTFKVKSIDSNIVITANIEAMNGMAISYSVTLDEATLEKTSSTSSSTSSSSTSGSTNSSSASSSTTTESTVKKGKLYTIQNTVSHESETGRQMARKYLNSSSKVELIDGQYYVTLTFTGAELMKNHSIYVNGSKVSHTVTSKSDSAISLRFKVSKLSDTIKVAMYVVPMASNIEFTVKLLENTLTFVKEYDASTESGSISIDEDTTDEVEEEEIEVEIEIEEETGKDEIESVVEAATSGSQIGAILYTTAGVGGVGALTALIRGLRKRK